MTNICAAIGLAQLEQADSILTKKRQIAQWYKEELDGSSVAFHQEVGDVRHSYWMCSILVDEPVKRDLLRAELEKAGIETRPLFYPVHTMPMYAQKFQRHPVAENLGWRDINLPSWPDLRHHQIVDICSVIKNASST